MRGRLTELSLIIGINVDDEASDWNPSADVREEAGGEVADGDETEEIARRARLRGATTALTVFVATFFSFADAPRESPEETELSLDESFERARLVGMIDLRGDEKAYICPATHTCPPSNDDIEAYSMKADIMEHSDRE